MKALAVFFKVLSYIWAGLFAIVFLLSIIGMFLAEPSFYHGWKRVTATLSPFNSVNYFVVFICLLPAFGFYMASEYFEKRIK
ncbi:MAG: hypothetical protein C4532_03270 [Candidatus Abyssobacteria bacterium SURF_17]|uniref:Uncharacterized protein n=1 Tax=Candidatus Abyssobacteria bacterium SURF_17 TaxID=2093361 RepID=A0A419F6K6_9BACT|nr:MAG: hypothetical protein C4532_03270 [Candidatus Abyssubacteria bacterium SURF_17]